MSIKVMSWVWESVELKAAHKLVLLSLADNANDDGVCWPSITTIARKCGLTDRYVQRILNELKEAGLISIAYRRDGSLNKSNVYTVHWCTIDHHPGELQTTTPSGLQTPTPGGALTTTLVSPAPPDPSFNRKSFNHQDEPPAEAVAAAAGAAGPPNSQKKYPPEISKNDDQRHQEELDLLHKAGIFEPTASEIVTYPHVDAAYLEAHINRAVQDGIAPGLLVTRLRNNDPPPITAVEQDALDRERYADALRQLQR